MTLHIPVECDRLMNDEEAQILLPQSEKALSHLIHEMQMRCYIR